jgi:hypothetical protein
LTVSVSVPALSDPEGMLIVALPLLRVVVAEVYPPPVSVTDPVGVGLPLPPFTTTLAVKTCAVVTLLDEGVTVTVGVVLSVWNCCAGP